MTLRALLAVATVSLCLSACGGNNTRGITSPPPVAYTVGGTVAGLSGTGLVLQDNGGDNLPVNAAGTFTFPTSIVSGGTYNVTVLTQPSGPVQTCLVTNGSGMATANITSVQVVCVTIYTIGGTVSGLSGTGLVLQDNAGNNLTVNMNGGFTFSAPVASGGNYDVTIFTQPSHPAQTCLVTSGSGMANANITSVQIVCTTTQSPQWTWVNGGNIINQPGIYGTQGTPAPTNVPGPREQAVSWTDNAGNLWLFGGASAFGGALNDLWQYSSSEWTWIAGANVTGQAGIYGTQGVAAPGNVPGARAGAVTWTDAGGNLWLFGGYDGNINWFNDLWKYSAGEWTWVSGANTSNQNGIYGTMGTATPLTAPGARWDAVSWIDAAGNLWLFGGNGFDSTGLFASLNDLWKYQAGQWTWMSGSNLASQSGTYGTQGVAAPGNVPGARSLAVSWHDAAGNLWLFGGNG